MSGQENTKRYGNTGVVVVPLFCKLLLWGQGMDYGFFITNCQDPILPIIFSQLILESRPMGFQVEQKNLYSHSNNNNTGTKWQ